ncbi:PilW family protein [Massilia soli]|uniref:PilW family protein n=1 Tax=Massilia soli TaxID=2792854 RepID=A0ABS7STZ2_9BURK|nr:PilW family protein [Massilia soli]MBZ2209387.1 PilW family protein [Massilia soli]
MTSHRPALLRAQRGFSLTELLIAATIGLVILAGMSTLFVNNSRTQAEIEKANRQVENGRFAMQTLSSDLRNAGFYGEFDPTILTSPAAVPDPCAATVAALKEALPLPVQGIDNATTAPSCLPGLVSGTDILVVRRTDTCVVGTPGCAALADGGPYFQASLCDNNFELGSGDSANYYRLDVTTSTLNRRQRNCNASANTGTLAVVRRYLTHVYYVASDDREGDGVPTLKRAELGLSGTTLAMTVVPLVNGIENLQLEYGLDTNGDGVADVFNANPETVGGCAAADCAIANWRQAVSVKLNLLAVNLEPTTGYVDATSYVLGLDAAGEPIEIAASSDAYKRHVFQSLVAMPNPAGRNMP